MTETTESNDIGALRRMMERYAPVQLAPDISHLSNRQRTLLAKLIQASRILNTLCLQQMWSGNLDLLRRLETDRSPEGDLRLQYFWLNKGPWSDLDEHKSFLPALAFPDIPRRKPLGAAYYPEHLTREGFEGWVETLAPEDRRAAEGFSL